MIDILSPPWLVSRLNIKFPRLNYNRDKLKLNWKKTKDYYRSSSLFAPSNHLLIQILSSITFDKNQSPSTYYGALADADYYFASISDLTSDIHKAKVFLNGYFYGGKKCYEIYVHDTQEVDIKSNWREWQPIKVRSSQFIDYSYSIPMRGNIDNVSEGITVISINIKMLAMQYYFYLKSNTDMLVTDVKRNIGSFVVRYPLCNMLPSIIDCSYLNEYRQRLLGEHIHSVKETNPVALNTKEYMFDRTISDVITAIRNSRGVDKANAIAAIPMIFTTNPFETYGYYHRLENTNNIWILSYLKYSLLNLGCELSLSKDVNRKLNGEVNHEIKILKNSRYIEAGNKTLAPIILSYIDKVTQSS
jgi:hypothetical protein